MLRELITLLEETEGCLSVAELGRRLHAEPSAVDGMVQTLVQRGRLLTLDSTTNSPCEACSVSEGCTLAAFRTRRYIVAPRDQQI